MNKDIIVLGIETSCDETACGIVKNGRDVLCNIISSQIETHKKFGGVVPEVASRLHVEQIGYIISEALEKSGLTFSDIDIISATYGPGLVGALLTGLSYGKGLAFALDKPFVGVNHIDGHICANYMENQTFKPPFICLIVSGGHTHIVKVSDYGEYNILGKTCDDAAGEAYDKVARTLGLPYPGGPNIEKLAKTGNENAIIFPKAFMEEGNLNFSFSGLKSAVLNYINIAKMKNEPIVLEDVAASFQKAVIDVLCEKVIMACKKEGINAVAMAGGVSSNGALRHKMQLACDKEHITFNVPSPVYCTDNGAMIASSGYFSYIKNGANTLDLNANPTLSFL